MPGIASSAARAFLRTAAADEPRGVRMARPREQLARARLLDDVARVHDDDVVAGLGDDAEIVRDEQKRHAELAPQPRQELEDLRLDRDVERGGRLVGDHQRRAAGERHGDHHALAHAAGHLVRIVVDAPLGIGDADQPEQLGRLGERRLLRDAAMDDERLGHLRADGHHRVERGHRLLEDHRDLGAAHLLHLALGQRGEVAPAEAARARRRRGRADRAPAAGSTAP